MFGILYYKWDFCVFCEKRLIFIKKCFKIANKCSMLKFEFVEFTFLGLLTRLKKGG